MLYKTDNKRYITRMQAQCENGSAIFSPDTEAHTHRIGYARVSTADQDPQMQIDALLRDGVQREKIYHETASGAAKRRPQFEAMLRDMRPGDVITVWKLDRLGRTTRQVLDTIALIHNRGAKLRMLTDMIDTSTPMGTFFLTVVAAWSQLERDLIRERTNAGLRAARERGRIGGRLHTYTDDQIRAAAARYENGAAEGLSWKDVAADVIGRNGKVITVTRLRARIEELRKKDAQDA